LCLDRIFRFIIIFLSVLALDFNSTTLLGLLLFPGAAAASFLFSLLHVLI
jgi:hypothetical protein